MRISQRGLELIKEFEGFRSKAYLDPVGIWTIGFGTTRGVKRGDTITRAEAEIRLISEMAQYEIAVLRATGGKVNQPQFDALASFAYNVGGHGMAGSSVIKAHLRGDYQSAARAFSLWNKGRVNGVLVEFPGLTRRRAAEAALYLTPAPKSAPKAPVESQDDQVDAMPHEVEPERSMASSEINRAAAVTGGTAAVATVAEMARGVADVKYSADSLGEWLVPILMVVVVALCGYIIWQRVTQRKRGWA